MGIKKGYDYGFVNIESARRRAEARGIARGRFVLPGDIQSHIAKVIG